SFNRDKAIREMEEIIDEYLSRRTFRELYAHGEDPSALDEAISNHESSSSQSVLEVFFKYMEIKDISFSRERCRKLHSLWDNASRQVNEALNTALDSWTNSIEPIIQERVKNLSSKSPEPVSLTTLTEIERLFDPGAFDEFQDETLNTAMNQLNR